MGVDINDVSIGVEVAGFVLTFIEIIFPSFADRVENFIQSNRYPFLYIGKITLSSYNLFESPYWYQQTMHFFTKRRKWLIDLLFVPLIFLLILVLWVTTIVNTIGIIIMFLVSTMFMFVCLPLSYLIEFLNYISKGKALGALGLLLAFVGLIFECYQYFQE